MEKILMGNKYDLATVLLGATTSTFFMEMSEKVLMTSVAMVIGTTISFLWRRKLHQMIRKNNNEKKETEVIKEDKTNIENEEQGRNQKGRD